MKQTEQLNADSEKSTEKDFALKDGCIIMQIKKPSRRRPETGVEHILKLPNLDIAK